MWVFVAILEANVLVLILRGDGMDLDMVQTMLQIELYVEVVAHIVDQV